MEFLTLGLLGALLVALACLMAWTRGLRGGASGAWRAGPIAHRPSASAPDPARARTRRLNAIALQECAAAASNDEEGPPVIPELWAALRSPLVLLVSLARAGGHTGPDVSDILESWIGYRLEVLPLRDRPGVAAMERLRMLCDRLDPSEADVADAGADCRATLSARQKRMLLDHLEWMQGLGGQTKRAVIERIRTSLGRM